MEMKRAPTMCKKTSGTDDIPAEILIARGDTVMKEPTIHEMRNVTFFYLA